jgi:hypothetical protein
MTIFEQCCILLTIISLILQAIATFSPQRLKNTITISTVPGESTTLDHQDKEDAV